MATWRQGASLTAQNDLDGLLGLALPFAEQQLAKHGEFYPYAVVVTARGHHEMVAADLPEDNPESSLVVTTLLAMLLDRRDGLRAAAIAVDSHFSSAGTDAVRVSLEHSEGHHFSVLLPYAQRQSPSGLTFGQLQLVESLAQIW